MNKKHIDKNAEEMLDDLNVLFAALNAALADIGKAAERDDMPSVGRMLESADEIGVEFDRTLESLESSGVAVKFDRFSGEYFDGSGFERRIRVTSISHGYLTVAAAGSDDAIRIARDLMEAGEIDLIEDELLFEDGTEEILG